MPSPRSAARRTSARLVVLGSVLVLAACATVPTSGPVREGGDLRVAPENAAVPFIAAPPQPGASAEEVVRGFLRAGADFRNDHFVARRYLTPQARQEWQAEVGTTVYGRIEVPPAEGTTVTARGSQVARIDAEGTFRRTPAGTDVVRSFPMARVDGEWRIASLEDGLLLSPVDVQESYRQVSLFFLSPSLNTLVPDTVLLPELPGLSTRLVSRLLRGPTMSLRGGVATAFPRGTELEVPSVPVHDGLVTVRLDRTALNAADDARERMAAQIVWTVKQLGPEISAVLITAGGEVLVTTGVAREQPRDSWATFDPNGLTGSPSLYLVRDGHVGRIFDGEFVPVAGPAGVGETLVRSPAVALDESRMAAVSADGRSLLLRRLAADAPFERVATGRSLARPSWDPLGNLWFVDRATGVVSVLPAGASRPGLVEVQKLPGGGEVVALAVSRDGTRVALVTARGDESRLLVAVLSGVDQLSVEDSGTARAAVVAAFEVLPDLRGIRDVAWADAQTLAVLGSRGGLPADPFYTSTDGYDVEAVQSEPGLVALAAAPPVGRQTSPLVVETSDGRLAQYVTESGPVPLGEGSDPAYPG